MKHLLFALLLTIVSASASYSQVTEYGNPKYAFYFTSKAYLFEGDDVEIYEPSYFSRMIVYAKEIKLYNVNNKIEKVIKYDETLKKNHAYIFKNTSTKENVYVDMESGYVLVGVGDTPYIGFQLDVVSTKNFCKELGIL